jgi:hypothetical protein
LGVEDYFTATRFTRNLLILSAAFRKIDELEWNNANYGILRFPLLLVALIKAIN